MKTPPVLGKRYKILAIATEGYQYLVGREITVDTLGEHLRAGYYSLTGRVAGVPGSFDFPDGISLGKAEEKKCSCHAYPFIHSRGRKCLRESF